MNPGCAAEQHAWREVKDGWRPLYGDVDKIGVAVEWHDFRTEQSFNWDRTFHPNSLEFCLNLDGRGAVGTDGRGRSDYAPGNCSLLTSLIAFSRAIAAPNSIGALNDTRTQANTILS
jgi:hypothetical protein